MSYYHWLGREADEQRMMILPQMSDEEINRIRAEMQRPGNIFRYQAQSPLLSNWMV